MKKIAFLLLAFTIQLAAQPSTQVYLAKLDANSNMAALTEIVNVSQNTGYNNQPSFLDNTNMLYAATRDGQTDILVYNLASRKKKWLSDTGNGSEYSPLKIPSKSAVSAIRLDTDGKQLLYSYSLDNGAYEVVVKDLKIGYHLWLNPSTIVCTVLVDNRMDLVVVNTTDGSSVIHHKQVGRSLQHIPNSNLISFISTEKDTAILKSLDPKSGGIKILCELPQGVQDIVWLNDGSVLAAKGKSILLHHPENAPTWRLFHDFRAPGINSITRMAVSTDQKNLAFVSAVSPEEVVNKQLAAYNSAEMDKFLTFFSPKVSVQNFFDNSLVEGIDKMRSVFEQHVLNNEHYQAEVVNRIVIDKWVIDLELIKKKTMDQKRVAIYEVVNDKIKSATFLEATDSDAMAEAIIEKQLEGYNAGDITGFMDTYSEDIALYNYPGHLLSRGQTAMRENYKAFFAANPNLKCSINNRIVLGNKVIDHEFISTDKANFSAVAIYEVKGDKIVKVTFLR